MKAKLGSILFQINQNLPLLTYVNTFNDTFPEEYRFYRADCWSLFNALNTSNKELLYRPVKSINGSSDLIDLIMKNELKRSDDNIMIELRIEIEEL